MRLPIPGPAGPTPSSLTTQNRRTLRYVAREFLPIRHCRAALADSMGERGICCSRHPPPPAQTQSTMIAAVLGCWSEWQGREKV